MASMPPMASAQPVIQSEVDALLQRINQLDGPGLCLAWRNHLGGSPPAHLPRWLLARLLAYRVQVAAYGGLDARVSKTIRAAGSIRPDAPFANRAPQSRDGLKLMPGTVLAREWQGVMHPVTVQAEGFDWNGTRYGSLSQVAKEITGTNWNGHRFFGLKASVAAQGVKAAPGPRASATRRRGLLRRADEGTAP